MNPNAVVISVSHSKSKFSSCRLNHSFEQSNSIIEPIKPKKITYWSARSQNCTAMGLLIVVGTLKAICCPVEFLVVLIGVSIAIANGSDTEPLIP